MSRGVTFVGRRSWILAALALVVTLLPLGLAGDDARATTPKNRWSVGLYRGASRPDYVAAHEAWLGRPVETVLEMIPTDGWQRIDNPSHQLNVWKGTPYDVVFTTPMLPKDGTSTLAAGANGDYDAHWRSLARSMIAAGRPDARIRLGHEFNHTHYPWNATNGKEASYAAYYRRIVEAMRSEPGAAFRFTWNVLSGVKTADVERAYPGDAYVDVVSLDLYDGAGYIANFEERWRKYETQPYGLDWLRTFATAHGKPMAFDEWALIKSNDVEQRDPRNDSGDDTVFVNRMIDFFETENVAYANYFDANTKYGSTNSKIQDGPYPNATATYLDRIRATGTGSLPPITVPPITVPVTTPPTTRAPSTPSTPSTPRPSTPTTTPASVPPPASKVVLIVGRASPIPSGDVPLRDRLTKLGMTPTLVDDDALTGPTVLNGATLVVISSSVVPTKVPAWLATVAAPILDGEAHIQALLGIASAAREEQRVTSVKIVNTSHPLAAGKTNTVAVQMSQAMASGTPVASATVIAAAPSGAAAVYALEKGARLVSGNAPARRLAFFTSYESPTSLTADGWALFDAAVRWLASPTTGQVRAGAPGAAVSGNRVATVRDGALVLVSSGAPEAIVAGAATPSGAGAWSVTADGRVFTTGDASHHGSRAGTAVNAPIVGIAPTPTGRGYWLLGGDGGIFTFGDAGFHGSTGAMRLNRPVVGMASTASGDGYWLFAADGGIFTFGDAAFHGSTGALRLNAPVTTMAPTPTGRGYWLLGADGGVFTFGDAAFHGSTGSDPTAGAIEAIVPSPTGAGYWLIGRDARLHRFGDAR